MREVGCFYSSSGSSSSSTPCSAPGAGGSARRSAQRGGRAGSRLIRAAASMAGVPPAPGMDPSLESCWRWWRRKAWAQGTSESRGRQCWVAPRGQNPGFLWRFPPEGLFRSKKLFSQRAESQETAMGMEAVGKGAGGLCAPPPVGDRSSRGSGTQQPGQTFLHPTECPEDRNCKSWCRVKRAAEKTH